MVRFKVLLLLEWRHWKETRFFQGFVAGIPSRVGVITMTQTATMWQSLGRYEYEVAQDYDERGQPFGTMYYTGRCRAIGGRLADGTWPVFGELRRPDR
jgi:hypothetical protein